MDGKDLRVECNIAHRSREFHTKCDAGKEGGGVQMQDTARVTR